MSAPIFLLNYSTAVPISIHADTSDRPDVGPPLAEANYQIPILWLALFTEANITTVTKMEPPEPTLFTSRQDALATYERRKGALRKKLGAARASSVDDWERMLASEFAQGAYFQIEFSELYYMYNEGEFQPDLLSWLKGLEELTGPGWESLCAQAEIDNPTADTKLGIRGWTPHEALGWKD
jgi:hypothetical protein